MPARPLAAQLALGLLLAGCTSGQAVRGAPTATPATAGTSTSAPAPSTSATPQTPGSPHASLSVPKPDHVVVVVMENHAAEDITHSADTPFITGLTRSGASFTRSYAVTHPSQPNYLALFSGSTQGVVSNTCRLAIDAPNLATGLTAVGRTFVGYSEGLPAAGFQGCRAGAYARKHNPWASFTNVPGTANQPLTAFPKDYARLPDVAFIVPDLDHDMHDGTVAQGDAWLAEHVGAYARWAMTHNSLLVLTFDEDDNHHDNRIATVVVGDHVRPGVYSERVDHYRVLRMLCDLFGVRPMGHSATAAPITGIWGG